MTFSVKHKIYALTAFAMLSAAGEARAQYYDIANQIANMVQSPLSGSSRYKGFVEAGYTRGLGDLSADLFEITTTQGMQYNSWFFMGAGIGVQGITSHPSTNVATDYWSQPGWPSSSRSSGVMIPLYTDFRFTPFGTSTGIYVDLRAGCSFLIGKNYLRIGQGYLTNQEYFYLKPSIGVRVPVNGSNPKQAVDFGVSYQLLTSNYWCGYASNTTLNALGVSVAFEW